MESSSFYYMSLGTHNVVHKGVKVQNSGLIYVSLSQINEKLQTFYYNLKA